MPSIAHCEVCGKEYTKTRSYNRFCSRKCLARWRCDRVTREYPYAVFTCEHCGKQFQKMQGKVNNTIRLTGKPPRFCTIECMYAWRRRRNTAACEVCGQEFQYIPSRLKSGPVRFCSMACSVKNRQTDEYVANLRNKASHAPNASESLLASMFPDKIEYTGDGGLWLTLRSGKHRNPDFRVIGKHKLVELFGSPYHRKSEEPRLIAAYAQIGWDCIVIWADDLRAVKRREAVRQRIAAFLEK